MALVGYDGAVLQYGRVLLQQREDFGTWGLPGGGLETGEYLPDGVRCQRPCSHVRETG